MFRFTQDVGHPDVGAPLPRPINVPAISSPMAAFQVSTYGRFWVSTEDGRDVYLAIPLQKGQISCRELMNGERLLAPVLKDSPITISDIDSPYSEDSEFKKYIFDRGL